MANAVKRTKEHFKALEKLFIYFNTQSDIAQTLGISRQCVYSWYAGKRTIPYLQAKKIEKLLLGKIKALELRPDLSKNYEKNLARFK